MPSNVHVHVNPDKGELVKIIDDRPYQEYCAQRRAETGDGFIRDKKGSAVARLTLSIPVEEFAALLAIHDPDAEAWWADNQDRRALRRLVARYPHWQIASGRV